jgi:hypothetical protein
MRMLRNGGLLIAALGLCACTATAPAPALPASAASAVSVATPPTTAVPPAPTGTATAVVAAPALPVTLASLPAGAALYGAARTPVVDAVLDLVPEAEQLRGEIARKLGGQGRVADVLGGLGVAADRPLLVAVLPPDMAKARHMIDTAIAGKKVTVSATEPALSTAIRVVVPLVAGRGTPFDPAAVGRLLDMRQVERCPGAEVCQRLDTPDLVAVITGRELVAAVRVRGDQAEIDLVRPLLVDASQGSTLLALRALAMRPTAGPEPPRCARLDPAALGWLCIDADRMAELGVSTGYGLTVAAVAGASIPAAERKKIMEVGRTEAGRNLELAAPKRRLLDDGTVSILPSSAGLRLRASWALTAESRPALEAAFSTEACSEGGAVGSDLLPKLAHAFGDPGPDFVKPDESAQHILEAGWAGYPIVLARTWPNFLASALNKLGPSAPELARAGRTCARVAGGRLELDSSADLFWQRKSP